MGYSYDIYSREYEEAIHSINDSPLLLQARVNIGIVNEKIFHSSTSKFISFVINLNQFMCVIRECKQFIATCANLTKQQVLAFLKTWVNDFDFDFQGDIGL